MIAILFIRYAYWFRDFSQQNRRKIINSLFSNKTLFAIKEVFAESLLHFKIYRTNPVLGFMHMSLAFGWFLLILGGKLESWYFTGDFTNPFWYPIFLRFFEPDTSQHAYHGVFLFFMEFSLLLVLMGVALALGKRIRKSLFGIKNITKHSLGNKLALYSLWLIFPLRLLAESATASAHEYGGFLTASVGSLMPASFANEAELYFWWAYSWSLGIFFVALPFSRYLHIPTEMVLIFLRRWNVDANAGFNPQKGLQAFEVHACPGCGVCLDVCPAINKTGVAFQSAYFVQQVRNGKGYEPASDQCLNCGQCDEVCPVGINLDHLRIETRSKLYNKARFDHSWLPGSMVFWREATEVILFTGCMGRLNPQTTASVKNLLNEAGLSYIHMDENESICCGRPMALAGAAESAKRMIVRNRENILAYHGKVLVTTCPICYKIFKSDYNLDIPVMHHSEYLWQLVESGKIVREKSSLQLAYHDPCDLGRGSSCYEPPRNLLQSVGELQTLSRQREMSLCCGNNLGSLSLSQVERQAVTANTLKVLTLDNPDVVVTSCPMCKKTLQRQSSIQVADLAEVLWQTHPSNMIHATRKKVKHVKLVVAK
jgi:Fe-S oxidoreductase